MTLIDIMAACAKARSYATTESERMGVDRTAASILDAFGLPPYGPDRQRFLNLAKGQANA